jgi:outer membrane immunogenic protein
MGGVMRIALVGLALLGIVSEASAADLGDVIRGSTPYEPGVPTYFRWEGVYGGGQVGYSSAGLDFSNTNASQIASILRVSTLEANDHISEWPILGRQSTNFSQYGGFIGYNSQWDDVILGIEANYSRTNLVANATGALTRGEAPGDGQNYLTTVTAADSVQLVDYATLRGRAGYVMGRFMPYALLGVAVGRAEITRFTDVTSIISAPSVAPFTFSQNQSETTTKFIYGYAAGLGIDVALMSNLFVRAEWEYVQFTNVNDTKLYLNSGRLAAAVKF